MSQYSFVRFIQTLFIVVFVHVPNGDTYTLRETASHWLGCHMFVAISTCD